MSPKQPTLRRWFFSLPDSLIRTKPATVATVALVSSLITLTAAFLLLNFMLTEKKIEQQPVHTYDLDDPQFRRSMDVLLGPPIVDGNKVQVLLNGDQIFPSMLGAIRGARRTITFETYIYWSETLGKGFSDALIERARAGVKVHVMLDFIGSIKMNDAAMDAMKAAGIELQRYHKPVWWKLARLNNRTHRKLLIVDGKIGFTGGVGIVDKWRGAGPAHMFSSSPTGGSASMHLMYLMAITAARRTILLSNTYFVPDELTVKALVAAAGRGVAVQIITPGADIDSNLVRAASRARWGDLLKAGIKMAEYQPTMFHVKSLVIDSLLVSVGSTNFDNRSFSLNDEANLNVLDRTFAQAQAAVFNDDWRHAKLITLAAWEARPWSDKIGDKLASLIGAQL